MVAVSIFRQTVTRKDAKGQKRQEKCGAYRMRWRDPTTGRPLCETTGTYDKGVAKEIAREKGKQLSLAAFGLEALPLSISHLAWADLEKRYLTHVEKTKRPATAYDYRLCLKNFVATAKPQLARDVTTNLLLEFAGKRRDDVTATTVNRELRVIRACLRWADKCRLIYRAPSFDGVFLRENQKLPVVIHDFHKQVLANLPKVELCRCSADWWTVFLSLAHSLGCRRGELIRTPHSPGLLWGRVSLDRAEIKIVSESSKGRRERDLPLDKPLVDLLTAWKAKQGEVQPTDSVLPYKGDLRRIYADLQRIEKATGVEFKLKNLRSTCGSELVTLGVPTVVVKDILGHASVTTTEKFYTNTSSARRSAVEKRSAKPQKRGRKGG